MLPRISPPKQAAIGLSAASALDIQSMFTQAVSEDGGLAPDAIRALLRLHGVRLMTLAKNRGCDYSYFGQIIRRHRKDRAIQDIIARAIGLSPEIVWGQSLAKDVRRSK